MDLTTTKKIKRRVFNIEPLPGKELTDCTIKVVNWTNKRDLSKYKFKISSFLLNNSSIACFIPKWISTPYTLAQIVNKVSTIYPTPDLPNATLTNKTLNYMVAIKDINVNKVYARMVEMDDALSKYLSQKPPIHPATPFDQYNNKYYHFFNTSDFCEIVQNTLIQCFLDAGVLPPVPEQAVRIVRNSTGYALYVNVSSAVFGSYEIQFCRELIDLFQFRNSESSNSTFLYALKFNSSQVIYESLNWYPVFSNYVPNTWFPYDLLVIKSDLPVESELFYNNNNYMPSDYENINLSFKLVVEQADAIYNVFTSDINPASSWLTFMNNNSGENVTFQIQLRLRETDDLINYTIKQGEKCYFVGETLETE